MIKKIQYSFIILFNLFIVNQTLAFWNNDDSTNIQNSLVKVYTTQAPMDYYNPWTSFSPSLTTGSASIIEGNKIITNAHVVSDAKFIQVRKHGESKKYKANLEFISHDADLALLKVEDESFFKDITPIQLGNLPSTQQKVTVYGFPFGGDSLSITQGILSRIEHNSYAHNGALLLAGQIDAAINPGNSGGPVIVDNKLVGVVMQAHGSAQAENLGYMVPVNLVKHFLNDIKDNQYDGFPSLGIKTQKLESPSLRKYLDFPENKTGIVVVDTLPRSPLKDKLQKNDVILEISGKPIEDNQTIEFRAKERTLYTYFVEEKQIGDEIDLKIFRDEKIIPIKAILTTTHHDYNLVPHKQFDKTPRYYIYGGIVFIPLSTNLIQRWGKEWSKNAPKEFLNALFSWPEKEDEEVVVALKILAHEVNEGYHEISNWIISEVNNQSINTFKDLVDTLENNKEEFITFKDEKGYTAVIEHQKAIESIPEILNLYRIPSIKSVHF